MWQVVGILEPEQRIYEALTPRGQATVADLAAEVGVSRDRASRILGRLAHRGLVTRLPGRPARFAAVTPDLAAATLIAAQESQLQQLRVHAQQLAAAHRARAGAHHPAELIEVIEGALNVRNAFRRLQREARQQMRVFDKPPYTAPQPDGSADEYGLLREGRVRYRTLYDRAGLGEPGRMSEIWNGIRHGEQARATNSLPMKMALCDDRLALIPVSTSGQSVNQNAYLVHPSSLLDALSELFEATWDRAVPLNHPASPGSDRAGQLTERDRDLVGLLAAGSTDESIARTFGWSARTVHRHVHRLMSLVGAQTRFQAGLQAARQGWL
jgi:DNA-binding CsgD family transcriptional regulator/DNA-binding MarR family transcriptional regulator